VSREIVRTELKGFIGPIAHHLLDALNDAWERKERTLKNEDHRLEELEKLPHRNKLLKSLKTVDGYEWFSGESFSIGNGKLVVFFPWGTDDRRKDSSRMDRSIGIYTQGTVDPDALNKVLLSIIEALQKLPK